MFVEVLAGAGAGKGSRFADRYGVHRLVHVECAPTPRDAIAREKQIKRGRGPSSSR